MDTFPGINIPDYICFPVLYAMLLHKLICRDEVIMRSTERNNDKLGPVKVETISLNSEFKRHGCSLHFQNNYRQPIFGTWG